MTQKDKILKLLRTNGKVSRNEALRMYISRLSSIMLDLKHDGVNFETRKKDGDYEYHLLDKPKIIEYRVQGQVVATKTIW